MAVERIDVDEETARKLRELDIQHYDKIIHDQKREWLQERFSKRASKFPINVSMLVRNLLWQSYERIQTEDREPFDELIRTFWYSHLKPTLVRANALSESEDQAGEIYEALVRMVVEYDLFDYRDLNFRDQNEGNRTVRSANPNIILFAEKDGFSGFLQEMGERWQITTITFGGQPGAMSSQYLVDNIKKEIADMRRSFYTFSIVDYDPSGWIVRDAFLDNLRMFGIRNIHNHDLVNPDMLSVQDINFSKFPVPTGKLQREKNENWLEKIKEADYDKQRYMSNRPDEDPPKIFGLESEAIKTKKLKSTLKEKVEPLLGASETQLKISALDDLEDHLKELVFLSPS